MCILIFERQKLAAKRQYILSVYQLLAFLGPRTFKSFTIIIVTKRYNKQKQIANIVYLKIGAVAYGSGWLKSCRTRKHTKYLTETWS